MLILLILSLLSVSALAADSSPVVVSLYYESLCPYSKAFVLDQLMPTYTKLNSIIRLELVPFGNAKYTIVNQTNEQFDVKFVCQHGPQECLGNEIQSCAASTLESNATLALVNCMFKSVDWLTPAKSGFACAQTLKLDWSFLVQCSSSPLGRGLELYMGERTAKLNPPHKGVPWVTINGKHTDDIQTKAEKNLLGLICETYTGTKPAACT